MQLQHPHLVSRQHGFEMNDALDRPCLALARLLGREQRGQHIVLVPSRKVDRDLAARRQRVPVTPHGRLGLRLRPRQGVHVDVLGIQPFEELIHHLAAARGRDAGNDHHESGGFFLVQARLRVEQRILQSRCTAFGGRLGRTGHVNPCALQRALAA
jgi:hypothetical protein